MRFGFVISGLLTVGLVGCTGGAVGGGSAGGTAGMEAGARVGRLEVTAPLANSFVLRGTLPVPPGSWPFPGGDVPFGVIDYDGTVVPAQMETVSRYADPAQGADVVEILATVRRDPSLTPGTRLQYDITVAPWTPAGTPGTPGVEDLYGGPTAVPTSIASFLANPANLVLSARDCFDNEYTASPLGTANGKLMKYGRVSTQLRTYDTMLPVTPDSGPSGTLPHLFGIHSYLSVLENKSVILFDLRVNNGADGHDKAVTDDNPLAKVYFDNLDVRLPEGWVLLQDGVDPMVGAPTNEGSTTTYPIVQPMGDGTLHLMPSQGQFHRRLIIAPAANAVAAQALLDQEGLGFCVDGVDPDTGVQLFSWWNTLVPNYFPQSHTLPSLAFMGLPNLRATLTGEFQGLRAYIESGTGQGTYPVPTGNLGWAHPYGVSYGGMTGGAEIHLYQGVRTAAAASVDGYRHLLDQHRMQTDRMPTALFNRQGEPSRLSDWLVAGPNFTYSPFLYFSGKMNGGTDVFGYDKAPTFQVSYVTAAGLAPTYDGALQGYQPIDSQHLVRYTRSPKALVWLGNDSLSKDDLLMQAENFRLSFHEFFNSSGGYFQSTGLRADMVEVAGNPGRGFAIGRGAGWGLDCAAAAYAISRDDAWRTAARPWLETAGETIRDGQASCSGIIQAQVISHLFNGRYKVRQSIEAAILENGLRGMRERVFEGVSSQHETLVDNVLINSYYAMVSDMCWDPTNGGPWSHLAVGPLGDTVPWCSPEEVPADGTDQYLDTYQVWSSLAYGYELTGDPLFLNKARIMAGGGSLQAAFEKDGFKNIYNRAAIFALAQEIND